MRHIVIIDDFYKDPDEVRKFALSTEYVSKGTGTYPGQNSARPFLPGNLADYIGSKLPNPVVLTPNSANGHFRLHYLNDSFQQLIHADQPADWGGVLYLNTNDQCKGGTAFWRHKEFDRVFIPTEKEALAMGMDAHALHSKFNLTDGLNTDLWEQTFFCPARFNRLVLFPAKSFHSHAPVEGFGDSKENCRLVQLFFFNNIK